MQPTLQTYIVTILVAGYKGLMNKQAAIDYFGSVKDLAEALNISTQAIYKWPDRVPELQAMRIDRLTEQRLRFDPADY